MPRVGTVSGPAASRISRARRGRPPNVGVIAGLAVLATFMLASLVLPLPQDPLRPDPNAILQPPGGSHLFGTDSVGFDVFSRTIESAQRDLPLALIGTLASMLIGVPLGLFASSGRVGEGLMRVIDAFAALPMIIIAVVAVQLMGGGMLNIILALAIVNIPRFMRLVRGEALALRKSRFVEAAIAIGCSPLRVGFNHVFRNAYGIVLVQASLTMANAVVVIAAMSFLGIGVSPPTPTWGSMIQDGTTSMVQGKWWVVFFPALAIFLVVSALNMVADGIEKHFEDTEKGG
jgi:ABC-type dipeptide/oligopeptide/nickel transport system permease subunit